MGKPGQQWSSCPYVAGSEPGEVKHFSTQRNRKQQRVAFCLPDASGGWKAALAIPLVAASETGTAQTGIFGYRGSKAGAPYLYGKSYKSSI